MLRRIVCFTALASILALTGCNGRSIDYLIARASLILSNHTNKSTVLVVTSIPVLTKLVKMETPTQLPVKVVSLLTSTPSPTVETVATLTPGLANTSTQASAIEKIRADLDLPRL